MQLIYYAVDRFKVSVFGDKGILSERKDEMIIRHFLEDIGLSRGYKNYKSDSFYLSYNGNDNLIIELYPAFIMNNGATTPDDCMQLIKNMLTLYDEDAADFFVYKINRCDYCLDYIGDFKPFKNGTFIEYSSYNGKQSVINFMDTGTPEYGFSSYIQPFTKGDEVSWKIRRYEKSKEIFYNNKQSLYSEVYSTENVIRLEIEVRKPIIKTYSKERDISTVNSIATMILNRVLDTQGDIKALSNCIGGDCNIKRLDDSYGRTFNHIEDELYRRLSREIKPLISLHHADYKDFDKENLMNRISNIFDVLKSNIDEKQVYYYRSKLIKDIPF